MKLQKVTEVIQKFARQVVTEAKANASKDKVTGTLVNSIRSKEKITLGESLITFFMEGYGKFVDAGVEGVKGGRSEGKELYGRKFRYTSKGGKRGLKGMPPTGPLDKWVVRKKGLSKLVRDNRGRFIPRKTLVFLIAKSIFIKGLQPSLFFTLPFKKYFKQLPDQLAKAYGEDFITEIKIITAKNNGNI
tara:strand:+ start:1852 stop:2418 length:567 start_codon:yes stop_codon:yes gene_type:complete